jgi:hypothetical protein
MASSSWSIIINFFTCKSLPMLKSIVPSLLNSNTSLDEIKHIIESLSFPSIISERLDPDGHDLITLIVAIQPKAGPTFDAPCLELLSLITNQPGFPKKTGTQPLLAPDYNGQTPIFYAARDGRTETLKFLHERFGYDLGTIDRFGQNALFYAAREGRLEILKLFKQVTSQAGTPAVALGAANVATAVDQSQHLQSPASDNPFAVRDKNGQSPIFYACERNHLASVKWLIEEGGVDPETRDNIKRMARNYATNAEVIKFLNEKSKKGKKRKIEQVPAWANLTKEVLRVSGVLTKFPELASFRKNLDQGEWEDFSEFYRKIEHVLKTAPDVHDYFLQLAMATGLVGGGR